MSLKFTMLILLFFFSAELFSQIELKRPSGRVGINKVDVIVERSFKLYEQLFDYQLRINDGEILDEENICKIEEILIESDQIIREALAAKEVLKKEKLLTRTKGTIHLERAKRALYYSKEICNKLLPGQNSAIEN